MPLPRTYDLAFYQGNTTQLALTLTERPVGAAARPKDLTGYTIVAQIRKTETAAQPLASFSCVLANPTAGQMVLTLDAEATAGLSGDAVWDLTTTSPSGYVRTWLKGVVHIVPRVSR